MPLKHLRVCPSPCDQIRYAACSIGCRVPNEADPANWRDNLQAGAGTMPAGHTTPVGAGR